MTPQRRAIVELLAAGHAHFTAEDVYQHISARMPDVSRTTVYSTLRDLVARGELTEVADPGAEAVRYDTNSGLHHHLVCLGCHKLLDIGRDFPGLRLTAKETSGFQITRHQVTFYGYCPACLASRPASRAQDD
jgi:Fur family ferric uptake transcriptional regulator